MFGKYRCLSERVDYINTKMNIDFKDLHSAMGFLTSAQEAIRERMEELEADNTVELENKRSWFSSLFGTPEKNPYSLKSAIKQLEKDIDCLREDLQGELRKLSNLYDHLGLVEVYHEGHTVEPKPEPEEDDDE